MFQKLAGACCLIFFLSGSCKKADPFSQYEGNFRIKVSTIHPASSYMVIDSDSTRVDLSTNPNVLLTWKILRAGGDYFTITALDNPKHSLHIDDFGSPEVGPLPASTDNKYFFSIKSAKNNLVTIQSVYSGKYLYVPYCEKNLQTWSYDVDFVDNITTCNANNTTADTCYCIFAFQLVRE